MRPGMPPPRSIPVVGGADPLPCFAAQRKRRHPPLPPLTFRLRVFQHTSPPVRFAPLVELKDAPPREQPGQPRALPPGPQPAMVLVPPEPQPVQPAPRPAEPRLQHRSALADRCACVALAPPPPPTCSISDKK